MIMRTDKCLSSRSVSRQISMLGRDSTREHKAVEGRVLTQATTLILLLSTDCGRLITLQRVFFFTSKG